MKFLVFFKNFIVEISKLKLAKAQFRFLKIRVQLFILRFADPGWASPKGGALERGSWPRAESQRALAKYQYYDFNR